jgi:hypothetical protein
MHPCEGGGGEGEEYWIFVVPIVFSKGFQHVPNSSLLYPICFALTLLLLLLYNQPNGGNYNIFWECPKLNFSYFWVMGNQRCSSQKIFLC